MEKKFATKLSGEVAFNSSIGPGEFYQLIPNLPQATTSTNSTRIGDTVRPTSMTVLVSVHATDYQSACSVIARLFIVEDLTFADGNQTSLVPDPDLLLDRGNNQSRYLGTPEQAMIPVNRNRYKVHTDKSFKIEKSAGYMPNLGNTYDSPQDFISPNQIHQFRIRVPLKKTWKYDADSALVPSNQCIWLALGYYNANGVVDYSATRVTMTFNSIVYYTDA